MQTRVFLLLLALVGFACASDADSVCQDIGYCRTESDDQVQACQQEAKRLGVEAAGSGCAAQSAAYFSCAADKYDCRGNVPTFVGCEGARGALDSCLAQGRAHNACGELAAGLAACPGGSGPPDPSAPPPPCGAAEVCSARCYLDHVPDLCRPQPLQIAEAAQCAQQCPL